MMKNYAKKWEEEKDKRKLVKTVNSLLKVSFGFIRKKRVKENKVKL